LTATAGGSINNSGSGNGIWIFVGTEAQSNALALSVGSSASPGDYTIQISGVTKDGNDVLEQPITETFRLRLLQAAPARHLQPLDDIFIGDLPTDLNEGCADSIKVDGADTKKLRGDMFTLLDQGDQTVSYRFAPNMAAKDNYYAVLYPEAPIGQTACPVLFQGDTALTLTANCYDNKARFYVFINSEDGKKSSTLIPNNCENVNIADREGGNSQVYEVTLPCSPCLSDTVMRRAEERHLLQTPGAVAPQRLHKALAASLKQRNHRHLQQLEGANSEFQFEIKMTVNNNSTRSSAEHVRRSNGMLTTTISMALVLWHLRW
jgi:hypothetical protein